jgi:hypothetical protein
MSFTMKARFLLGLLLVTSLTFAQSEKKIAEKTLISVAYVQTVLPHTTISCGEQGIKLFINNRRVIFESRETSFDLKVTRRKKEIWIAKDKEGTEYYIKSAMFNGEPILAFLPNKNSGKRGVIICKVNICD